MRNSLVLLLASTLLAAPLFARPSIDIVIMSNGDRFTCEIKTLEQGVLRVGMPYVDGTVSLEWLKVVRIESTQLFKVETEDGLIYTGTMNTADGAANQQRIIEVTEFSILNKIPLEQIKIVKIDQQGDSVWRNFHADFSLGFIYNKANQNTQYNTAMNLSYRPERNVLELAYSSALSNTEDVPTTTRNQLDLTGQRMLRWNKWYYTGAVNFLQSSAQEIEIQKIYAFGIGRYLWNTNSLRVRLTSSLGFADTQYTEREDERDMVAPLSAELFAFRFKKFNLTIRPVFLPYLTDFGRVRYNLNTSYNHQIISDLWLNFTFYGNWDNRPPTGLSGTDYGTSVGISYSFH